jgi:hypothetical protein
MLDSFYLSCLSIPPLRLDNLFKEAGLLHEAITPPHTFLAVRTVSEMPLIESQSRKHAVVVQLVHSMVGREELLGKSDVAL